jgi:hypothetical protein
LAKEGRDSGTRRKAVNEYDERTQQRELVGAILDAVTAYCDRNQVELHPGDVMAALVAALGQLIEDSCVDAEGRRRAIKVIEEMLPYMESQLDARAAVRTGGIN